MKHFRTVTKTQTPAEATTLLEWNQIGVVITTFVTAFNTFVTAVGNFINIGPDDDWSKTA